MARIRSIHPGIWTDEDFVQMSAAARLFLIGLWNEADDYGLLEWRPTKLKMRLAPADNIDAGELMDEIRMAGFLVQIERCGRSFCVIRNFRRWQRPQRPSAPMLGIDEELAALIALPGDDKHHPDASNSETPPKPFHEHSAMPHGKSFAMEDVGGRKEEEGKKDDASASSVDASADECAAAVAAWNALADEMGFAKVSRLTSSRRQKLKARLRQCGGLGGFDQALIRIRGSPLCRGEVGNWRANFDFLLSEQKFTRLMEGVYDGPSGGSKPNGKHGSRNGFDAAFADLRDMFGEGSDDLGRGVGPERPDVADPVQRLPGGGRGGGALPGDTEGDG